MEVTSDRYDNKLLVAMLITSDTNNIKRLGREKSIMGLFIIQRQNLLVDDISLMQFILMSNKKQSV